MNWLKKLWETITSWFKPKPTPTPVDPNLLKGYGMVSYWMTLPDFVSFAKTIKDNGCNCTSIELFGQEADGWLAKQDLLKQQLSNLLTACRAKGIRLFVNMVNWGSGSLTSQPDSWFQGWLDFIKQLGPDKLIVQAAAEWHDDKAARWCQMAEDTLTGFVLSWNKGSRPSTATSRYAYIDYHSASMSDYGAADKRIICNTDSGILNEMQNGGIMGQTFIPEKVTQFATEAISQGKSVNLYGFNHKNADMEAIKTLGRTPNPNPTPNPDNPDGFVFGENCTWLGSLPCSKDAQAAPNAKILTAEASNTSYVNLTYAPEASQQWWTPYDQFCYGPHGAQYKAADGKWYAGRADWFPIQLRNKIEIGNYWKSDTPFKDHYPVVGNPFYFFAYSSDGRNRSTAVQVVWKVGFFRSMFLRLSRGKNLLLSAIRRKQ